MGHKQVPVVQDYNCQGIRVTRLPKKTWRNTWEFLLQRFRSCMYKPIRGHLTDPGVFNVPEGTSFIPRLHWVGGWFRTHVVRDGFDLVFATPHSENSPPVQSLFYSGLCFWWYNCLLFPVMIPCYRLFSCQARLLLHCLYKYLLSSMSAWYVGVVWQWQLSTKHILQIWKVNAHVLLGVCRADHEWQLSNRLIPGWDWRRQVKRSDKLMV